MARVTVKGQVTLPKSVRDALGIMPGSEVEFELKDGEAVLRRRVPDEALARWTGRLKQRVPHPGSDDLIEDLRGR